MDRLTGYEQYKELMRDAKARGCNVGNCFFLPKDVRAKASRGSLSFCRLDEGLLLIEDAGPIYRLYYQLSVAAIDGGREKRDGARPCSEFEKPVVIELVVNGGDASWRAPHEKVVRWLGFELGRRSGHMAMHSADAGSATEEGQAAGVAPASESDCRLLHQALWEVFDPRFAFLPTYEDYARAIEEGRVLLAKGPDGIAGALDYSYKGVVFTLDHLWVRGDQRGRGIARSLLGAYHRSCATTARSFNLWVDLSNTPAVSLYEKAGYAFLEKRAYEYVRNPR